MKARSLLRVGALLAIVAGALALSHQTFHARTAHAGPSLPPAPGTTGSVPIVRIPGSSKAPKPPPVATGISVTAKPCVALAYERLKAETTLLEATYGRGTPEFNEAYAAKKTALVSRSALEASGCF